MLEVDPDYPQELHNIYNNHTLATEKINLKKDVLSNHCESIIQILLKIRYITNYITFPFRPHIAYELIEGWGK